MAVSPSTATQPSTVAIGGRRHRLRAERLALFGLLLLLSVVVFANRWGEITPDWVPQLYLAPFKTLIAALSAWRAEPFLGQPNIHAGLAPTAAFISLIRLLGAPAWVAIRIFRILMLACAGWGAMRLFHRLGDGSSNAAGRLTVVVAYAANPFVIVSGSWMPTLLPYALLPWLLLALDHSVRDPRGWRWPAAFALCFFLMGGVNGGVVPLLLVALGVPAYLLYVRLAGVSSLARALDAVARCALLSVLVSLYWIIPTFFGRASGASIAFTTERPGEVAATSSYSEVLRLLGFWLMYGYRGNQVSYGSAPLVVLATYIVPAVALSCFVFSRSRIRLLAVALLAFSVPVVVGLFPPDAPTPLGRAMRWSFDRVPGAIAFRTTTKAGALPALAVALLLGVVAQSVSRWRLRFGIRALVAGLAILVIALESFPALTGQLYPSGWRVPGYWKEAAEDLNTGSTQARVLLLPGNYLAVYRWGMSEVEDLNESLLDRPSAVRTVLIYGSNYGANLLAGVDTALQMGSYRKGTLPVLARYLGASDILLRNDMVWEESGGARPSRLALELYEPGLRMVRSYGNPGQNVVVLPTNDQSSPVWSDQQLPPLQRFEVSRPGGIVRAEPVSGTVLVDGDNFALGPLVEAGLLDQAPAYQLLGTMRPTDLVRAARDGARIVLTDSNRRRIWTFRRTDQDSTATLSPTEGHGRGRESYTLFWDQPWKQTVTELRGARSVRASGYGSVFGPVASSRPALAFDGDPQTAWLVGDYGKAVGQWIRLDLNRPTVLNKLVLQPTLGGAVEIRRARVTVGARTLDVVLPHRARVTVSFPPTTSRFVRVEITGTRGVGTNPVGFREITVQGATVSEVVRLPQTFAELVRRLPVDERDLVLSRPIDILFTRESGDPGTSLDDEERTLTRDFALPGPREFHVRGSLQAGPDLPDETIDQLVGLQSDVIATSSARAFGSIFTRASQAVDGDPNTAWLPTGTGDRIELSFPAQRIDRVVVRQGKPGRAEGNFVSHATISLNGGPPFPVTLSPHNTEIRFRARSVHRIQLSVTRIDGLGGDGEVRIGEIQLGRVRVPPTNETTPLRGCVPVFGVDGRPIRARVEGTLRELASGSRLRLSPCNAEPLSLPQGHHHLQATTGWLIEDLHLASTPVESIPAGTAIGPPTRLTVTSSSPSKLELTSTQASAPYFLVTGQAFDDRWNATMDGRPLGTPIVVDGYSVGWRIDDLRPHRFTVAFGPQRWVSLAQLVSGAAIVLLLGLVFWPRRRRRLAVPPTSDTWRWIRSEEQDGHPAPKPLQSTVRGIVVIPLGALLLWFIGGVPGLALGAAAALVLLPSRRLASRVRWWPADRNPALAVPAILVAVIPFIVLFTGLPPASGLTAAFVRANMPASYLAEFAFFLLVCAVLVDARRSGATAIPPNGHVGEASSAMSRSPDPARARVSFSWIRASDGLEPSN